MINLSVQQVLSLWAHGTVLRNLTGNWAVAGKAAGRGHAGGRLGWLWHTRGGGGASCGPRGLECGELGFACALLRVGGQVVPSVWEPGEAAPWLESEPRGTQWRVWV